MTTLALPMKLLSALLFASLLLSISPLAAQADTEYDVYGDTATAENDAGGWLFNRDASTDTPFEFNAAQAVLGNGSLYVLPITNTEDGSNDKFIGELFIQRLVDEVQSISYDYRLGDAVPAGKANEFYANVYVNFDDSNDYGHCVYNVVPSEGSAGWHTMTFNPSSTYDVRQRGSSPETCPESPADMPEGAEIRMFAINLGDSSNSDQDLDGYFDNVVLNTVDGVTTYDFEPFIASAEITAPLPGSTVSGMVDFVATYIDLDGNDGVQWAVRAGSCGGAANTVYGNVDGKRTDFEWDSESFTATIDMSGNEPGEYCFVFNPREDAGDTDLRATRLFTLEAPAADPLVKEECFDGGWEDFGFKNQGQCVRFAETEKDSR